MNLVNFIHPYIHEYDFPYDDYLQPLIPDLIKNFFEEINKAKAKEGVSNYFMNNSSAEAFLIKKIHEIVRNNYNAGDPGVDEGIRISITNEGFPLDLKPHNHINQKGNLLVLFYTNLPEREGELAISNPPNPIFKLTPKINKIYIMPNWLYHYTLPHKESIDRICFNYIYGGNIRPSHKFGGLLW